MAHWVGARARYTWPKSGTHAQISRHPQKTPKLKLIFKKSKLQDLLNLYKV